MIKVSNIGTRLGISWSIILITFLCVLTSVLVCIVIGMISGTPDFNTLIFASIICPALIAPPIVYYYAKLNINLEDSRRNQEELNNKLSQLNQDLSDAFDQVKDEKRMLKICKICQDVNDSRWQLDYFKQTGCDK